MMTNSREQCGQYPKNEVSLSWRNTPLFRSHGSVYLRTTDNTRVGKLRDQRDDAQEPDMDDNVPPVYNPIAKAVDVFKHPYFYGGDKEAAKAASKRREEVLGDMTVQDVYDKYVLGKTMNEKEEEMDRDAHMDDVFPVYDPTAKAVDVFKHPYFYGGDKEAAKAASKRREEVLGDMTVQEVYDKYVTNWKDGDAGKGPLP